MSGFTTRQTLSDTLILGDTTGGNDIIITSGDEIQLATDVALPFRNGATGQSTNLQHSTEELLALVGASVSTTNLIPGGAVLVGVTIRVTTSVTGATSFDVGVAADPDAFGSTIVLTAGTTTENSDFTANPITIWEPLANDIILTANGPNFTAGAVKVAAHFILVTAPTV